jgi:aquaporin Z
VSIVKKAAAELLGTFWLTFAGCGSAVFAASFLHPDYGVEKGPVNLGIGFVGVSLAFGLAMLTMAYALGHVSGCHLNPAVTVGLVVARRVPVSDLVPYVIAQVAGAIVAAFLLSFLLSNQATGWTSRKPDESRHVPEPIYRSTDDVAGGVGALATNGYGPAPEDAREIRGGYSPGGFSLSACFVGEVVLTFFFVLIFLGSTDKRVPAGFAPVAIGLGLTLAHLVGIPLTNLSVNPARSIGPALVVRGDALAQLWLFVTAPVIGAALAGLAYPLLAGDGDKK